MKQWVLRIVGVLLLLLGLVYAGDYLSVRYRIPGNREQFGTVTVDSYYAIQEKNNKTELVPNQPEAQTCVRSLFPHFGYNPCWYVSRHTDKRIDL